MLKKGRVVSVSMYVYAAALGAIFLSTAAAAQSAEVFFEKADKLTLYVGSGAGGGYDLHARLLAHHLSRFLPGHPNIVVENMPTAVGVQASNFLYNSVPKDGSVILAGTNTALSLPIYDSPIAHYDARKFEWIGSSGKQRPICVMAKKSDIATLEDAQKREVFVGTNTMSGSPGIWPQILNSLAGTKFKVIAGYNTGTLPLAVERGEVAGICGFAWETYQAIGSVWFKNDTVNVVAQMGREKIPEFPNSPLAGDFVKNANDKEVLDLIELPGEFGWPYVAPPGTPADRMALYRKAFQAVMTDPQFLADAAQEKMIIDPLDDKQIQSLLAQAYAVAPDIRARAAVFAAAVN